MCSCALVQAVVFGVRYCCLFCKCAGVHLCRQSSEGLVQCGVVVFRDGLRGFESTELLYATRNLHFFTKLGVKDTT